MTSVYQQGQPIQISDSFSLSGTATNPTLLVYTILNPDGTTDTFTWPGAAEITNPVVGSFLLALDPPALAGLYQYDVDATGTVTASRSGSFFVIADRTVLQTTGPCTSWVSPQDVWDCCGQPMTTIGEGSMAAECPVDMTQFAYEASQLLYQLSAGIYSGICEKTVRPCSNRWCGFQVLSRGHIVWDPYDLWAYGWSGWGWNWGGDSCSCQPLDRILLSGYPVQEIIEVKIDGVVVNPDTYRLDQKRWLTRVADPAEPNTLLFWPSCQRMDLPDTETGTFSVSYLYGQEPPLIGIHAASQLGCELYKACTGSGECNLPTGTVRVTRQGITISRTSFQRDMKTGIWATGLNLVDAFLSAYNPTGLTRRPSLSGLGRRYARQVG